MNQTIQIQEHKINGTWCNVKTTDGKEISIAIGDKTSKIMAAINSGSINIECNIVEKNGKSYAWDVNEQKSFPPKFQKETPEEKAAKIQAEELKQRMIIAQSSLSASVQYFQQRSINSDDEVLKTAKKFYDWVILTSK